MKKIILITLVCFGNFLTAQNSLAKIEYSYAEEAFAQQDYKKTLEHLEEVKSILGSTNARILYLEILSRSNSLITYEAFSNSFTFTNTKYSFTSDDISFANEYNKQIKSTLKPELILYINKNKTEMILQYTGALESFTEMSKSIASYSNVLLMYNMVIIKLKNGKDLTIDDYLIPTTDTEITDIEITQNHINRIDNWLEKVVLINSLCDTYIENFESEAPLEKLKSIYETYKQNKIFFDNKDLLKSAWELLDKKDYSNAKVKFSELQSNGIDHKFIIEDIQNKIEFEQLEVKTISNIESNMIFVEGDSNTSVPDLYVSKFELTKKEYMDLMDPDDSELIECANCPITFTKTEADIFITALNQKSKKEYRLPTKEEWYWFATGGLQTTDDERGKNEKKVKGILEYAWCSSNSDEVLKEIGNLKPNELGLYDLWGNAAEYTSTNVVGGSYVTKSKKFTKGNTYTNSFNLEVDDQIWVGIRLVLTAKN